MKNEKKNYCIYIHINTINQKVYIGQTKLQPYSKRWGKNGNYYKGCPYFWSAIQKYGWDNFEHNILEDNLSLEEANQKEKYYIQKYNSTNPNFGYNIFEGGYNHTMSNQTKEKISNTLKGIKRSEETKRKISEHQYLKRKIRCIETGQIFDSITEACKWANLKSHSSISNVLRGDSETAGKEPNTNKKLHWEYYTEEDKGE